MTSMATSPLNLTPKLVSPNSCVPKWTNQAIIGG